MKKWLFLLAAIFSISLPQPAFAEEKDFRLGMKTEYRIDESGITTVNQRISITNLTEFTYTPSYSVNVGMTDVSNVHVRGSEGDIPFTVTDQEDKTKKIDITFANKYIGLNKVNTFTISFDTSDITKKRGRTWEVSIPGYADISDFAEFTTSIYVPDSFGPASIMKPSIKTLNTNPLVFNKNDIGDAGVYILFGDKQIYNFHLTYHISNTNLFPIRTEIALPPTTNYQEVVVDSLEPKPIDVYQDEDGNWLAEYRLSSSGKMTVVAEGSIEVKPSPQSQDLSEKERKLYLQRQKFWETKDATITEAAKNLKTPRQVYDYVVKTLTYNYDKASVQNQRLGALKILQDPKNAVCLEFTDLFVALARSSGIPARAVEGYAYTSDEKLRPLSLVKDVLHAWPEYYDDKKKAWVMVDPTWGNTTGGLDYFDTFDFDHIVFAIKGKDSSYPIPAGGYKFDKNSRDVIISFSTKGNLVKKSQAAMVSIFPEEAMSALPISGKVTIKNLGNIPIQNKKVELKSDLSLRKNSFVISYIPPFGEETFDVEFNKTPVLTNQSYTVTMLFDGITDTKTITVRVLPIYGFLILGGGISLAAIIISIIAFKSRRISVQEPVVEGDLRGQSQKP